ncbi:SDR family NAD(P)-dependent oxidoreductase [Halorubrum sp. CBA1125]|uniref:SDR family oxidoreductase n=1 Tax=Halorubrum sp. CBA1125 TaxID=2668072 RepID=UPI0012E74CE3|nr:SDR family oxidoreductase [Halorubrum sp. CBA1125]MUW13689.1 SDR family NAD(P)-dependent oxidoreductase [Halorubrum sp. CBA1125]
MNNSLDGKTALVTGASSGIGRATAFELASKGADLALASRRVDRLKAIATDVESRHDVDVHPVKTDITDPTAVQALVEATVDEFGGIDVAVSNAGRTCPWNVESLSLEEFQGVLDVNVTGAFLVTREVLPYLREVDGNLVYVGSFAGKYPRPFNPVYAASKWWLRGFAFSIAGKYGDEGIGIGLVNPTEVRTEIGGDYGDSLKEKFEPGEVSEPEEIAEAIAFVATRESPNAVAELDLFRRDKFGGFD